MGRKRINRLERREVVSVSLPRSLIDRIDQAVGPKRTRSRWLEALLENTLKNAQGNVEDFGAYHIWQCLNPGCEKSWRTNRPKHRTLTCSTCSTHKIEHVSVERSD
jgi:metal-responsive CopG/Arc/MetJ family transcriptional regulator